MISREVQRVLAVVVLAAGAAVHVSAAPDLFGCRRGLVAVPRPESAERVLALADDGYLVHAVCSSESQYQDLAAAAQKQGMLGQRVYLERNPEPVPGLAERLADVVLIETLTPADLTAERKNQWLRVLAPHRGKLVAGGRGIGAGQLKSWLGDAARIVESNGQTYGILTRPAEPGADQWRHRHHAPDNRRASNDKLLKPELMTQWYSLPLNEGFWGTTVVAAGGRAYTLVANRRSQGEIDLVARSLHNGCELWRKSRGQAGGNGDPQISVYGGRSIVAAGDDVLWLADGADVVALNGETGSMELRLKGPLPGGQVKWLALVGENRVLVLAGPKDDYRKLKHQAFVKNPAGSHLALLAGDGQTGWTGTSIGPIDEREIALANGCLYYHARDAGTVALEVDSGKELWRNTRDVALVDAVNAKDPAVLLVSDRALMADKYAVVIGASWKTHVVALDPADGHLLWQRPTGRTGRSLSAVLRDGTWYGNAIVDARTGEASNGRIPQSICSVTSTVGDWFMTAFGDMYTIDSLERVRFADTRVPCDVGNVVADGVLLGSAAQCTCHVDIHGYRVAGVSNIDPHAPGPAAGRLEVFSGKAVPALIATPDDWPTHRHDVQRSGSTPVRAGGKPEELWKVVPATLSASPSGFIGRLLPSPCVAVAGLAAWVDTQGILRCIDTASGKERWRQTLGARGLAPPVIDAGRVFVGDVAGCVHAFSADDGTLLWRFAAAPHRRNILWYGQLFSTWPCTGGVLLHGGVLYVVAGFQETNGMHAYALDPGTGRTKWESHDAGSGGQWGANGGFGCFGHLAVGAGRLWLASGTFYPGSYSLADGSWAAAPSEMDHHFYGVVMRRGADIGVLDDRFVITGGMRLSSRQEPEEAMIKGDGYNALSITPPQVPKAFKDKGFFGVDMLNNTTVTPAWDGSLLVGARGKEGQPVAWACAGVLSELANEIDKGVDPDDRSRFQVRSLGTPDAKRQSSAPANPAWDVLDLYAREQVLCSDAVLVIHAAYASGIPRFGSLPEPSAWYLSALEREDGTERWRVELPSKPMHGGLAIDRNGNSLIVFDDGSLRCYGSN